MSNIPNDFARKLARCLEEEETDIYVMSIYSADCDDMMYFEEKDRERVRAIFKILTEDTRRHAELLRLIVDLASKP